MPEKPNNQARFLKDMASMPDMSSEATPSTDEIDASMETPTASEDTSIDLSTVSDADLEAELARRKGMSSPTSPAGAPPPPAAPMGSSGM